MVEFMSADIAIAPERTGTGIEIEGNSLRLIAEGPDRLAELLGLIDSAQHSLKLYFYIFRKDESGEQVLDRLIAALGRGVDVRLMVDGFGCSDNPSNFFDPFREAGGKFGIFGTRRSYRYLIRNHQKLAIADGGRLLMGGFNVCNDYFGTPADDAWRDLGLYLEGPAVADAECWFDQLERWVQSRKQSLTMLRRLIRAWQPKRDGPFHWLVGGPMRRLSPWAQAVKRDLEHGSQLDMIEAYFSPSRGMLRRIGRIGNRGRARLVTAARSDNSTTIAAARFLYRRLLRQGVRIYEYLPARLHMKLIVIDDIVYIGSANFDMRSLFINLELMLRIEDQDFASRIRDFVSGEIEDCQEITLQLHRQRTGVFTRALGWISYVMVAMADYTVTRRLNFPARTRPDD